jgi:hypothetical protein
MYTGYMNVVWRDPFNYTNWESLTVMEMFVAEKK